MNEAQAEQYIKIVQGLSRDELVKLLAGVTHFPTVVLEAIRNQLEKHVDTAWY